MKYALVTGTGTVNTAIAVDDKSCAFETWTMCCIDWSSIVDILYIYLRDTL